ncbi:MAG: TatD family hydrolase [Candidatus Micrarchaeota archaeon]
MVFIDSHCHLQINFDKDLQAAVDRMRLKNVKALVDSTNKEDYKKVLKICSSHPKDLFPCIGLNYDDAAKTSDLEKDLLFIEENISKATAIGEIGLDEKYSFTREEKNKQEKALHAQLEIAEKHNKCVFLHTRKAEEKVLSIIESYSCSKVLHCFFVPKLVNKALDLNCFISIPTVKNKEKTKTIQETPLENLLCETDSPFLNPFGQGRNEPAFVIEAYKEIVEAKKEDLSQIEQIIYDNNSRALGVKL